MAAFVGVALVLQLLVEGAAAAVGCRSGLPLLVLGRTRGAAISAGCQNKKQSSQANGRDYSRECALPLGSELRCIGLNAICNLHYPIVYTFRLKFLRFDRFCLSNNLPSLP